MIAESHPSVAIVLLNWNRWQLTLACLESVFRLDYPDFRVIVCDNDSSDDSMQRVRDWAKGRQPAPPAPPADELRSLVVPPVPKPVSFRELTRDEAESNERRPAVSLTLVQTGGNLGFAGGCNVGVRHALAQGTDYVWLLNNDTLAARESLRQMVDHVRAHAGVGICGSTLLDIHRPSVVLALGGGRMRRSTGAVWSIGHGSRWPLPAEKMVELESQRMDYVGRRVDVGQPLVSRNCWPDG